MWRLVAASSVDLSGKSTQRSAPEGGAILRCANARCSTLSQASSRARCGLHPLPSLSRDMTPGRALDPIGRLIRPSPITDGRGVSDAENRPSRAVFSQLREYK